MQIIPDQVSASTVYTTMVQTITPRPIAWVSTLSPAGITNLAPFSYFNGVSTKPAAIMFSAVDKPGGIRKDTVRNIEANRQFVVNVVPYRLGEPMFKTSLEYEYEVSEFEKAGLTAAPSQRVQPPRVAESPIHLECELLRIVSLGDSMQSHIVIGEIVLIDLDDAILNAQGEIDATQVDSIGRMGGRTYCRTTDRFELA